MKFKKDKYQVADEIRSRALKISKMSLDMDLGYGHAIGPMGEAIAKAVSEGFAVMMENEYTDDDFEHDLTLKP